MIKIFFGGKLLSPISIISLLAFLNFIIGCSYYRVTSTDYNALAIKEARKESTTYFILHKGDQVWHLKDVKFFENRKELYGSIETLSTSHKHYLTTKDNSANRYLKRQGDPTYEFHIYVADFTENDENQIMIPVQSITKMEIYDADIGTALAVTVLSVAAIIAFLYLIILLTKSSCPFVYIKDGESYQFIGEMYGGAISSSLERDDYMPLPNFKSGNGIYDLKITNELLEKQYTNLAELIVIDHPKNTSVLIDKHGQLHTIQSPETPTHAISSTDIEYTKAVAATDSNYFMFNDQTNIASDKNHLILTFNNTEDASIGKLVLNAKNSLWLDYIFGKFTELFGTSYDNFQAKQNRKPAKSKTKWSLDQGIPLSVYLKTKAGWQFIDYIDVVGPLAARDIVLPINLKQVKDQNIEIKLECGYLFWELDYAAMDFSENVDVDIKIVKAKSAIDETGLDVLSQIRKTDDLYLFQPKVGNEATILFPAPAFRVNSTQSCFLHSRGYYEYIRDYRTRPDVAELKKFKNKGSFIEFSKEQFKQLMNEISYSEENPIIINGN